MAGQHGGLVEGEVRQLDLVPDVERRPRRVLDQVARRGDADKDERQAAQRRIPGAILVEEADGCEEIVGEVQSQRRIDLVDEHHEALAPFDERHLPQVAREPVREVVLRLRVPPVGGRRPQTELILHRVEKPSVPLLGRGLGAELREIDDDGQCAFSDQRLRGADHEARLAHLPRGQDIGEISGATVLEQVAVGMPGEIDAAAGLYRAAGDEREGFRPSHEGAHGSTSLYNSQRGNTLFPSRRTRPAASRRWVSSSSAPPRRSIV